MPGPPPRVAATPAHTGHYPVHRVPSVANTGLPKCTMAGRDRVYAALRRWFAEGLPGLEDQSRAPKHPARTVDLKALAAIRRLQANPELGGFRVSAALEQRAIFLSPRTCRRILALHRDLGRSPGGP